MLLIDGNYLEGGGQIVRTALALSVLTQKPFTIDNIRAGRKESGLKNQHLFGIRALRDLCDGVAENAHLGSTKITFYPRPISKRKELVVDVQTAGSLTLLMQTLLLPAMFSGKKISLMLKGGTDVNWSPSYDYFANVVAPQFKRYGNIDVSLKKRGYYPKGRGEISFVCKKKFTFNDELKPLMLVNHGTLVKINGVSHASKDLQGVTERQAKSSKAILHKWNVPVDIVSSYTDTLSTGSGITLWATFSRDSHDVDFIDPIRLGADVLGQKGVRAEKIGEECALKLNYTINYGAPVDLHLADQLIPLLGIVKGEIAVEKITNHTLTNIYVAEKFLDVKFKVDEKLGLIKV